MNMVIKVLHDAFSMPVWAQLPENLDAVYVVIGEVGIIWKHLTSCSLRSCCCSHAVSEQKGLHSNELQAYILSSLIGNLTPCDLILSYRKMDLLLGLGHDEVLSESQCFLIDQLYC